MAVYFMAFYFATAIGLYAFGRLSDYLAAGALLAGATAADSRALGLHGAMYVVPIVAAVVAMALWAGSRTITADHARMERKLRQR
jgi:sulfite exporter TauE/SafE